MRFLYIRYGVRRTLFFQAVKKTEDVPNFDGNHVESFFDLSSFAGKKYIQSLTDTHA